MGTVTYEPTVRITSSTGAEIHVGGEVDEVFSSTEEGMRARVVEAIRQLAASAGEPVTATVIEGGARWPMIVHPDGTFFEAKALAATDGAEAPATAAPVPDAPAPEIIEAVPPDVFFGVDEDGRASIVSTSGNPDCHIILRGGRGGPNFGPADVADALASDSGGAKRRVSVSRWSMRSDTGVPPDVVVSPSLSTRRGWGRRSGGRMLRRVAPGRGPARA